MKIVYSDALVIGGGLAGLRAGVVAQSSGLNCIVLIFSTCKTISLSRSTRWYASQRW